MKANELRIGNKVNCTISNDHGIYHVLGFPEWTHEQERPVLIARCPKQVVGIDKLCPIKLTEEWLTGFGFNSDPYVKGYIGIDVGYTSFVLAYPEVGPSKIHFCWNYKQDIWPLFRELKHVHELQNLFFVLTGEDLVFSGNKSIK